MILLDAEFRLSDQLIEMDVRLEEDAHFDAAFEAYQGVTIVQEADPYLGEYEVTPKVDAQVLPTAGLLMSDDVIVKAIPIYDVSNASGGRTIYIAREV